MPWEGNVFEYGCFISHVGASEVLMKEFLDSLVQALKSELEPYMRQTVFVDEERKETPHNFNEDVAHGLCASACWILIYVPQFWDSDYCQRELQAMLELEHSRRKALGTRLDHRASMIIPIILRGAREDLPAGLADSVNCIPFNKFTTAEGNILRNPKYIGRIATLAAYVSKIYKLGPDLSCNCSEFMIPDLDGSIGQPPPPQPFPGYSITGARVAE
jgi:hypothetical protein